MPGRIAIKENTVAVVPSPEVQAVACRDRCSGFLHKGSVSRELSWMISRSYKRFFEQKKPVPTMFCELVNKLDKFFSVSRASLVLHLPQSGDLKLVSWWDRHCLREGVIMSIPKKSSLLYRVLGAQSVFHKSVGRDIPCNYLERKLLISRSSQALIICPAVFTDVIYGLVSLASPVPYAFELIENGIFQPVFVRFAQVIAESKQFKQVLSIQVV